jgi:hypothetical protein
MLSPASAYASGFANDHHIALALDYFALLANGLDRRSDFHFNLPPRWLAVSAFGAPCNTAAL